MKLIGPLLAFCPAWLSHWLINAANNHTTITFDDIPTQDGLGKVPSPYHYLRFNHYNTLKPDDTALDGVISEHDLNCAVSAPNALIGSRLHETGRGASFEIANATAMTMEGLQPYFSLKSFYIKPMDAPAPGTTVYVKGYSKARKKPLTWHVNFPNEYHVPFLVRIEEYARVEWNEIFKIEITADFGYDELDWEFCIDELNVQFFALMADNDEARLRQLHILDHVELI